MLNSLYLLIGAIVIGAVWLISGHDPLFLLIVGTVRLRASITLLWKITDWAWLRFKQEIGAEIQEHELEVLSGRRRRVTL